MSAAVASAPVYFIAAVLAAPAGIARMPPAPQEATSSPTRPPVLLYRPALTSPIEAAGSGIEPEVKLRAAVDVAGRVLSVEILAVTPASDLDEVFRAAAVESVRQWRFAPALEGGQPTTASVELSVQYRPGNRQDRGSAPGFFLSPISDPRYPSSELERLPREKRGEWLDRYARVAEKNLERSRRQRFDSPRFIVITDSEDEKAGEILINNLEITFEILHGLFDQQVEPLPEPYKLVAFLYSRRASLLATRDELLPLLDFGEGFFLVPGFFAFHQEITSPEELLGMMLHEAVHAFSASHFHKPGVLAPLWLDEGLAEYFGNSQIKKGQLIPGRTVRARIVLPHGGGAFRWKTKAGWSLAELKQALPRGEALSLDELLRASPAEFYGEAAARYYGMSWLFVHFLRHGEEAWADREFPRLLLYLVEGYPSEVALRSVYGVSQADLEQKFREYVRRF